MSQHWIPDAEQLLGVKWLVQHQAAGLLLDPGAGKTSITYAAFDTLKKSKLTNGMLVVAPFRPATSTWPDEQQEWTEFKGIDVAVLHGKYKDKLIAERHDVYVVNYEGLQWLIDSGHMKNLLAKKWVDILVFDELTKMKNASKKARRRELLRPWLPRFHRRWGLTGSPAANGLIHLFGQIYVLDLGAAFGPYITYFRRQFFVPQGMWGWRLQEGAEELIYKRLEPVCLRMTLGKGVKIPNIKYSNINIELPSKARSAYNDMEDQMIAILDNERVAAGSASAVYGKCWQIASGALFKAIIDPVTGEPIAGRQKGDWYNLHDEKLEALEDLVEELQGQQILVAYWFKHDLEKLQKLFGKNVPYIGSGVSIAKAREYEAKWNAGKIPVMLGHPMSMAHGVNFQKSSAHHIAWYTVTPDNELYDQFNRRLRRRGNKAKTVFVHHLLARATVDTWAIMPSLHRKDMTQNRLFDALRKIVKSKRNIRN
jgi:hypothetical protein